MTTSIDWPTLLPKPDAAYEFDADPSIARTKMSSGRFRQRKRFTKVNNLVSVSWSFTDAELAYFTGWFNLNLDFGVLPFNIDLAFGDGLKSNEAVFVDGKFKSVYSNYNNWTVTAVLEVQDANTAKTEYDLLIFGLELSGVPKEQQSQYLDALEDAVNNNNNFS